MNMPMDRLKTLFFSLLAIFLIIEEWLWDTLTFLGAYLSRLLRLEKFEAWLSQCPRKLALFVFLIPILVVSPINLLGLVMIAHGFFLRGLMVEILGKLLGTLLIARVFKLTKPQLLAFKWFAWIYTTITGWLAWAHARVIRTATYRIVRQIKDRLSLSIHK